MDIKLTPGRATASAITAITSKSYVHRLLIAAALYGGKSIRSNIISNDMLATVDALRSLGAGIDICEEKAGSYLIKVFEPLHSDNDRLCTVDCGESGSTARFIIPVAPLFCKEAVITGSGRLPERPMGPLCDVLRTSGVTADSDNLPIKLSKMPVAGDYSIPGNVSSQFISGLLFMLPLLEGRSKLTVTGNFESRAYVDMTVDVLKGFGADIEFRDSAFYVNHNDPAAFSARYDNTDEIRAEGDWSNAAYLMAIASLGSGVLFDSFTICGLDPDSIQGDSAITGILTEFGIEVNITNDECAIKGRPQSPVDVDCSQIPDLVPALAVLAAYADGDSVFRNVERLRIKECDRIEAVSDMLSAVGVEVNITKTDDSEDMTVCGKGKCGVARNGAAPVTVRSYNDHRIAMAAAALVFGEGCPVVIEDAKAVDKSFPGFYEVIGKMGINSEAVR